MSNITPISKELSDQIFAEKERWVPAQWVTFAEAPCGCRILVYADDVLPNPQLDTSHCEASTTEAAARMIQRAKEQIIQIKKEVAEL